MKKHLPYPQVQVGNFNQTIATLQLGGSETAIVVSIVICSVLLLLSVVGESPVGGTVAPMWGSLPKCLVGAFSPGTIGSHCRRLRVSPREPTRL